MTSWIGIPTMYWHSKMCQKLRPRGRNLTSITVRAYISHLTRAVTIRLISRDCKWFQEYSTGGGGGVIPIFRLLCQRILHLFRLPIFYNPWEWVQYVPQYTDQGCMGDCKFYVHILHLHEYNPMWINWTCTNNTQNVISEYIFQLENLNWHGQQNVSMYGAFQLTGCR